MDMVELLKRRCANPGATISQTSPLHRPVMTWSGLKATKGQTAIEKLDTKAQRFVGFIEDIKLLERYWLINCMK